MFYFIRLLLKCESRFTYATVFKIGETEKGGRWQVEGGRCVGSVGVWEG